MRAFGLAAGAGRTGLAVTTFALPVAMFALIGLTAPDFLTPHNMANINGQITALLIASLGQLVVVVGGGIDLSVGAVLSLASTLIVSLDPTTVIPAVLGAAVAVGIVNGVGVAAFGVHPLIMTLATSTFLQGLALFVHPVPGGTVPDFLGRSVDFSLAGLPAAFFWCLALLVVATGVLSFTRFGLRVFAIGASPGSAARNGVAVVPHRIACYVLCSLSAGVAGLYLTSRVSSGDATIGAPFSLDSVTAVALGGVQLSGGVGSSLGTLLGVVTLGLMTNGMNLLGISPFIRSATTGGLLLFAIGLQRRKVIGL